MKMSMLVVTGAGLALSLAACEKKADQPAPAPATSESAKPATPAQPSTPEAAKPVEAAKPAETAAPAVASSEVRAAGLTFTLPAGWETRKPSNNMRLAEARLPGSAADGSQDCVVAWFQSGGSVQDNLARWKGMVTKADGTGADPTEETLEVQGVKVHTIEMTGAYVEGGMMGGGTKRENWTFRGAIIETPGQLSVVRMTGPADAMATTKEMWSSLLRSMK